MALTSRLADVLTSDEHVVPLRARLTELEREAMRLLAVPPPPPPPPGGTVLVEEAQRSQLSGTAATEALDALKTRMSREHDLELTLSWRLERKSTRP
ncbi:hypothetical protein [Sphaerotilus montanus]|uniref:hypothetical protein n=1 Tax=Sphaerotilus montanus TaxID=522889 RepID=UPI003FA25586